jgi:hypothetical protein
VLSLARIQCSDIPIIFNLLFCCISATAPRVHLPYNCFFALSSTFNQGGIFTQELSRAGILVVEGHNEGHKNI